MRTDADRWNQMAGQIRKEVLFNIAAAVLAGCYLTGAVLRPKDPLYSVQAAVWAFFLVFICFKTLTSLSALSRLLPSKRQTR
jgi:hypothetical protein